MLVNDKFCGENLGVREVAVVRASRKSTISTLRCFLRTMATRATVAGRHNRPQVSPQPHGTVLPPTRATLGVHPLHNRNNSRNNIRRALFSLKPQDHLVRPRSRKRFRALHNSSRVARRLVRPLEHHSRAVLRWFQCRLQIHTRLKTTAENHVLSLSAIRALRACCSLGSERYWSVGCNR